MSRKSARQHAFTIIYQIPFHADFNAGEWIDNYLSERAALSPADNAFLRTLVEGTAAHRAELDRLITKHSEGWAFERIASVDLAIMRLAIFELLFLNDIPVGVAINEAVELAKQFGSDDSPGFINGLLAQVAKVDNHEP